MVRNMEACEECAQNCLLIHEKRRDPSRIVTSFIKVMIGDEFSQVMFLPPKFARTVSALVGQNTHLEDSVGRRWMVTVSKINGSIAFQKGWHAFSLEHHLELGDFLVFSYIMGSHFVVQIYGKSGCQKSEIPEKSHGRKKRVSTNCNVTAKEDSGCGNTSVDLLFTSAAEVAISGNNHDVMSNILVKKCQNTKRRRETHLSTDALSQKKGTFLMESSPRVQQKLPRSSEFPDLPFSGAMQNCQFGERMKLVEKVTEMASHDETRHGTGPKIINDCARSSSSSLAIKDNNESYEAVKTEPVDSIVFSALGAVSSVVGDGQSSLELPTSLPSISCNGRTRDKMIVLLRDPVSRLWPVLYHENYGYKFLASGWEGFSKGNNLQPGDQCVFTDENVSEAIYRVGILRK